MTATGKLDIYERVTDAIMAALEKGNVPWHKPWIPAADGWVNVGTGRSYRGINIWLLSLAAQEHDWTSPYWGTFKQWRERGGSVKKGEKHTMVVLWKPLVKKDKETGEETDQTFWMMRAFMVFNHDQTEGRTVPAPREMPDGVTPQTIADQIIENMPDRPSIKSGGNQAYYHLGQDYVQMPALKSFKNTEGYYGTIFHELVHSTGAKQRLDRKEISENAAMRTKVDYSKEELVAEMGSAMISAVAGVDPQYEQNAAYIASWLKVLANDKKMVVNAASAAQRAADFILDIKKAPTAPRTPLKRREAKPTTRKASTRKAPARKDTPKAPAKASRPEKYPAAFSRSRAGIDLKKSLMLAQLTSRDGCLREVWKADPPSAKIALGSSLMTVGEQAGHYNQCEKIGSVNMIEEVAA